MCRSYMISLSKKHYALLTKACIVILQTVRQHYQVYGREQAAEQDSQKSRSEDDCMAECRARPRTETNR